MPAPANDAWPVRWILLIAAIAAIAAVAWADVRAAGEPDTWILRGRKIYVAPDTRPIDDGIVVVRGDRPVLDRPEGERR